MLLVTRVAVSDLARTEIERDVAEAAAIGRGRRLEEVLGDRES